MTTPTPAEKIEMHPHGPHEPWMVFCRLCDGMTVYHIAEHTHEGVALDRAYWPEECDPTEDIDGYFQPDDECGIPDYKLHNARILAAAPRLLRERDEARLALAAATAKAERLAEVAVKALTFLEYPPTYAEAKRGAWRLAVDIRAALAEQQETSNGS